MAGKINLELNDSVILTTTVKLMIFNTRKHINIKATTHAYSSSVNIYFKETLGGDIKYYSDLYISKHTVETVCVFVCVYVCACVHACMHAHTIYWYEDMFIY